MMEYDELKAEVSRLTNALEEASADKIKAAQYGLQVLDEKQQLEVKFSLLQAQYDTAKAEAEATKKALAQFQSQQKSVAKSDIDHEESLLEESMNREQEYLSKIAVLEIDLKNSQNVKIFSFSNNELYVYISTGLMNEQEMEVLCVVTIPEASEH
ncbi:unnamed protein product [Gongylonema pulchrum]|uniref:GOLGA2L5 domain-containing protein n=1 Tax=Gongylonema pulchrum TaxID=637853 RepID=A0A183DME9_9BILA|nr:unnamed protein product [Gongylonema pulchrum]